MTKAPAQKFYDLYLHRSTGGFQLTHSGVTIYGAHSIAADFKKRGERVFMRRTGARFGTYPQEI